jgi:hypothetical protein
MLQAAPVRIQSWAGVELWRWWTPPDVAGAGDVAKFRLLSAKYRAAVWTVLLVCERCAAMEEADGEAAEVVPCGAVPVELWMLIFGFVRRNVPVQQRIQ